MINMNVSVDKSSMDFIERFSGSFSSWDMFMRDNLAKHLSQHMVDFIKPNVASKVGNGTGESEKSVRGNIVSAGDGFDIEFFGTLGAFYMDEGNFPASSTIYRVDQKPHPVGARNGGAIYFSTAIHGMGYRTPSTPTHYSDSASEAWETDDFTDLAAKSLEQWLNEVVL